MKLDAIEVFNARTYCGNEKALKAAETLNIAKTAGSDAHTIAEIGNAYTTLDCKNDVPTILREIKLMRTKIYGIKAKRRHIIKWALRKIKKKFNRC